MYSYIDLARTLVFYTGGSFVLSLFLSKWIYCSHYHWRQSWEVKIMFIRMRMKEKQISKLRNISFTTDRDGVMKKDWKQKCWKEKYRRKLRKMSENNSWIHVFRHPVCCFCLCSFRHLFLHPFIVCNVLQRINFFSFLYHAHGSISSDSLLGKIIVFYRNSILLVFSAIWHHIYSDIQVGYR